MTMFDVFVAGGVVVAIVAAWHFGGTKRFTAKHRSSEMAVEIDLGDRILYVNTSDPGDDLVELPDELLSELMHFVGDQIRDMSRLRFAVGAEMGRRNDS